MRNLSRGRQPVGGADALVNPYEVYVEHPLTGEHAYVLRLGSGAVANRG
jgi:hypothetical protein